jgi:hypothetical protein
VIVPGKMLFVYQRPDHADPGRKQAENAAEEPAKAAIS